MSGHIPKLPESHTKIKLTTYSGAQEVLGHTRVGPTSFLSLTSMLIKSVGALHVYRGPKYTVRESMSLKDFVDS